MNRSRRSNVLVLLIGLCAFLAGCPSKPAPAPRPMAQYPSPMADTIRAHERIEKKDVPGLSFALPDVLAKPVDVYLPDQERATETVDLLIHFHGAAYVPKCAVHASGHPLALAVVNLGSGSAVYERAFTESTTFTRLVDSARDSLSEKTGSDIEIARVYLSSFSAGYGAVRAILRDHAARIDGIILLDGLHTGYVPPRRVLADGGTLNTKKLEPFVRYAQRAMAGEKRLVITHSAIFPGTYASTTECADYLISALGLRRRPVLKWGPAGMQRLSETRQNGLRILAFAGNTAPDHIDHLHALPAFLEMLLDER